jgi:hypothetical protein
VVTLTDSARPGRVQLQIQSPVAAVLAPAPRVAARAAAAVTADQPSRRSWVVEARALAWQTVQEGCWTWCLLAVIGLVLPVLTFLVWGYLEPGWLVLTNMGVALVAGVSVFGPENRARTHRLLAHHGARPGLVWLVKLAVWGLGLAVILGPQAIMAVARPVPPGPEDRWLIIVLTIPLGFAVAQLCGIAIRRGITALVAALVVTLALAVPLLALVIAVPMLPPLGLPAVAVALLAVSWAWSGDWLMDRPAPGRWLRLGLLLFGTFTVLLGWYAGFRAWSVPDVGSIAAPRAWMEAASSPLPAERNAADLYREAGRRLNYPVTDSPEFLGRNREALDLLRRAAAQPECRFHQFGRRTSIDPLDLPPMVQLASLVTYDVRERQDRGDLAGAWDDLVVLFRMAWHFSEGAGLHPAFFALSSMERDALLLAMEWATSRGQTPERLHAALAAYRDLPKMPPAADVVRAEANLTEKTLNLPTSALHDWLLESMSEPGRNASGQIWESAWLDVETAPWERARARRVNRLVAAATIRAATLEPWQRPGLSASGRDDSQVAGARSTTPLAKRLFPNMEAYVEGDDLNEVARRALVQVLALRAWQLRHGGEFPNRLDALVPEELPSLPVDPYLGRPFGYVRWRGQRVFRSREALSVVAQRTISPPPPPGSWLLYSVGPNRQDDNATTSAHNEFPQVHLDIVFAIPPVEGGTDAGKKP